MKKFTNKANVKKIIYLFFIEKPYATIIVILFLLFFLTFFLSNVYTFEFEDYKTRICFSDNTETVILFFPKQSLKLSTETKVSLYVNENERIYNAEIVDISENSDYFIIYLKPENYDNIKSICDNEIYLRIYSKQVKLIEKLYD